MKSRILAAFTAVILAASCGPKYQQPSDGSNLGFALSFIRNADESINPDQNLLVSPYSAGLALSMLAEGAEGTTRTELNAALNNCLFKAEDLSADGGTKVESANSMWVSSNFSIRNRYVNLLEDDFDAFVDNLIFSDPAAVREINDWCSEHTAGKIPSIVDRLDPNTVLILLNALYFNAPWAEAFDPEHTEVKPFKGNAGVKDVPMMSRRGKFMYAEYEGCSLVQLPYEGGRYSMYLLLSPLNLTPSKVISYMHETAFNTALSMLDERDVLLTMPKFKIETAMLLNETLKRMGVRTAFTSAADFSAISESGPVAVDQVKQKCYMEVGEKGTEAAAVTSVQMRLTSARPSADKPVVMEVDRPFIFVIADSVSGNIMFAGKIMNL